MSFEIIPGGLLLDDDIPAPEKPIEDWTEEEKEAYHKILWERAEPGTLADTIKKTSIPEETLDTIIAALKTIKNRAENDAIAAGYMCEWETVSAEELLTLLILRKQKPQ